METVNINAPGYVMKGSPMRRNFNIGAANKVGLSGLTTKDSPMQWAWLAGIAKAIAGGAKAVAGKVAAGATKAASYAAKKLGAKGLATKLSTASTKAGAWGAKGLAKARGAFAKGGTKKAITKTRTAVTSSTSEGVHAALDTQTKLNLKGKMHKLGQDVKKGTKKFIKSDIGKELGMNVLSSMSQPTQDYQNPNPPSAAFADMQFGTGGSSPYTLKNSALKIYQLGSMLSGTKDKDKYKNIKAKMSQGALNSPFNNYKKGYYGA